MYVRCTWYLIDVVNLWHIRLRRDIAGVIKMACIIYGVSIVGNNTPKYHRLLLFSFHKLTRKTAASIIDTTQLKHTLTQQQQHQHPMSASAFPMESKDENILWFNCPHIAWSMATIPSRNFVREKSTEMTMQLAKSILSLLLIHHDSGAPSW